MADLTVLLTIYLGELVPKHGNEVCSLPLVSSVYVYLLNQVSLWTVLSGEARGYESCWQHTSVQSHEWNPGISQCCVPFCQFGWTEVC